MTTLLCIFAAIIVFLLGFVVGAAVLLCWAMNHTQKNEEKELEDEAGRD